MFGTIMKVKIWKKTYIGADMKEHEIIVNTWAMVKRNADGTYRVESLDGHYFSARDVLFGRCFYTD